MHMEPAPPGSLIYIFLQIQSFKKTEPDLLYEWLTDSLQAKSMPWNKIKGLSGFAEVYPGSKCHSDFKYPAKSPVLFR